MTLTDLKARLEEASGPDNEIDAALAWTFDRARAERIYWNGAMGKPHALPEDFYTLPDGLGKTGLIVSGPCYTTSVDAALELLARKLPNHSWGIHMHGEHYRAHVTSKMPIRPMPAVADAPTPSLALVSALITALMENEDA